jgi:co-chaperonin GroES (HSP10)
LSILFHPRPERLYIILDHIENKKYGVLELAVQRALVRVGTVKAVGAGVDLKVGDRVLVPFFSGTVIDLPELGTDHDQHRIMSLQEILAVVQE